MNLARIAWLPVAALASLVLAGQALAMYSTNYRIDWFTPLTSGGGGPASSASYAAQLTVGQSVVGASASASYRIGMGYWPGSVTSNLYLPAVTKR